MIIIENVSKNFVKGYSVTHAIQDINLTIKDNEFIALVGPSGSGKSTLLNLITGLDKISEGRILIDNQNIAKLNDKKISKLRNHEIGFVFQEFYLDPYLSVLKNVVLPIYFNSKSKNAIKRATQLLTEVGLESKIHAKPNELSGGQKQRVAIARALINSPKILIADEPTGNLDKETGEKILNLLIKIHEIHKNTLIIATHDEKIAKAANRIITILDGKI